MSFVIDFYVYVISTQEIGMMYRETSGLLINVHILPQATYNNVFVVMCFS